MKRLTSMILSAALLLMMSIVPASAEAVDIWDVEVGKIMRLENGTMIDLDLDGKEECVYYEILKEDGWDTGYRLTVGDVRFEQEGFYMDGELYLLKLTQYAPPMLLVCDYGPSDDYMTYFHVYENGKISYVGLIGALVDEMRIQNGIITAPVRGNILYTWYHDADYSLAHSSGIDYYSEDGFAPIEYAIYEIPRYLYPMGLIVTTKVDLPLTEAMGNQTQRAVVPAGSKVILSATDDKQWVYIQSADDWALNGWMEVVGEFGLECRVGNKTMYSDEVFEGLLFAD